MTFHILFLISRLLLEASKPGLAHCLPASYALKKTFFHVDRHTGHIGLQSPDLLVPLRTCCNTKVTRSLAAGFRRRGMCCVYWG